MATREKELETALRNVLNSQVVQQAPFSGYSEALSDARDLLAEIDKQPELKDLEKRHEKLLQASHRLAIRTNRITAEWRHKGTIGDTFGDEEMLALYTAQVLVEELTGQLPTPTRVDLDIRRTAIQDAARWLEGTPMDNDPEAREFYARQLMDFADKYGR